MGSIISSFASGFAKVFRNLFGDPLDFLSGKSCNSACQVTWDFICYIENFCVAHLLKMLMVAVLLYIVLLFFYLLHKTGICYCIGKSLCKMVWACSAAFFYACEYGCSFLCMNMTRVKPKRVHNRRRRDFDRDNYASDDEESVSDSNSRSIQLMMQSPSQPPRRKLRREHLERSLRPRSHRVRVGISRNAAYMNRGTHPVNHHKHVHNIKVIQTSKFVNKGAIADHRLHRRSR